MSNRQLEDSSSLTLTQKSPTQISGAAGPRKENRKARYTRQVIQSVFIELLQESSLSKITVTRICELADISRSTFYLYYQDPYDLMSCMENEFLNQLEQQLSTKIASQGYDYSKDSGFWRDLLTSLLGARELTQIFFSSNNSSFLSKCLAINRKYAAALCERGFPGVSEAELNYIHCYYENGSLSVISLWVREGFIEPPLQIAAILARLNGMRSE
ncbi:MAG: TetR/AcrR family transcriptional regulator [Coriobacteriia bacterium]|nr:TetR/AcrR family transcriptional regulator [Coriobacteriia bacterium]